jgi:uncharacterized protein (DUF433 family)
VSVQAVDLYDKNGPGVSPSAISLRFGATPMLILDRITTDTNRLGGEPCIRDLRLTVRRVVEAVALYPDRQELKQEYPELEDEDIRQALAYAAACLDDKILPLPIAP